MGQLLDDLQNEKPAELRARSIESMNWFRNNLRQIRVRSTSLMDEFDAEGALQLGQMYMFFYDAKTQDKLPYWDYFPLCIPIKRYKTGFMGLNLHYLPPILRAKMLDGLMSIAGKNIDDNTKFKLSYAMLQKSSKLKYFRPCYKHYLNAQVKSKFSEVKAPEWEIATFLPTAQFRKRSNAKVYYDSRQMIG